MFCWKLFLAQFSEKQEEYDVIFGEFPEEVDSLVIIT